MSTRLMKEQPALHINLAKKLKPLWQVINSEKSKTQGKVEWYPAITADRT